MFSRWSASPPAFPEQNHHAAAERDSSMISPNVQQIYRAKDQNHGSHSTASSIASSKPDKQRLPIVKEEDEKECVSGCGANSPLSWMCDKRAGSNRQQHLYHKRNTTMTFVSDTGMGKSAPSTTQSVRGQDENNSLYSKPTGPNTKSYHHTGQQQMKASHNATSKAHQFLQGQDSDDEADNHIAGFFNGQPETLLDVMSSEHGGNNRPVNHHTPANGFTQPKKAAKTSTSVQQSQQFGRFSPQQAHLNSQVQSTLDRNQGPNQKNMQIITVEDKSNISAMDHQNSGVKPYTGESRIVAPNVSKLSPNSAVEVRLQSTNDSVVILCSVDVLKMRSGFFHNILTEQELQFPSQQVSSTSTPHVLWRDPIILHEPSPFEAAAFLESLHEGRPLFRGEWSYCWTRLSVVWTVDDLILDYAAQIDNHMHKIVSTVQQHHWRTNPSILAGMRICIFRKGSNPAPTIVSGSVLESTSAIGYSKVRVAFDNTNHPHMMNYMMNTERNQNSNPSHLPPSTTATASTTLNMTKLSSTVVSSFSSSVHYPIKNTTHSPFMGAPPSSPNNVPSQYGDGVTNNNTSTPTTTTTSITSAPMVMNHQIVGDVAEPFWIQNIQQENAPWSDPDELFTQEVKRLFTITDKRMFWEMAKALIELPEISAACKGTIRTVTDLTTMLKRAEFRILWTAEAAEIFPLFAAADLIRYAYPASTTNSSYNNNTPSSNSALATAGSSGSMPSSVPVHAFHGGNGANMLTADVHDRG